MEFIYYLPIIMFYVRQPSKLLWEQTLLWWICKGWAKVTLGSMDIVSVDTGQVTSLRKMGVAVRLVIIAVHTLTPNVFQTVVNLHKDGK